MTSLDTPQFPHLTDSMLMTHFPAPQQPHVARHEVNSGLSYTRVQSANVSPNRKLKSLYIESEEIDLPQQDEGDCSLDIPTITPN